MRVKASLRKKIKHSVLLSPSRKEALLKVLPNLTSEQSNELESLLGQQSNLLSQLQKQAISQQIERNDSEGLEVWRGFFKETERNLRKSESTSEEHQMSDNAERLIHQL